LRPHIETAGASWPHEQVGKAGQPRDVRTMGSLTPRMYVAFRADRASPDTGPVEYILLYSATWPNFDTAGAQLRGIVDRLVSIELDTRVRPCSNLWRSLELTSLFASSCPLVSPDQFVSTRRPLSPTHPSLSARSSPRSPPGEHPHRDPVCSSLSSASR
jgi:hypothetical protein